MGSCTYDAATQADKGLWPPHGNSRETESWRNMVCVSPSLRFSQQTTRHLFFQKNWYKIREGFR